MMPPMTNSTPQTAGFGVAAIAMALMAFGCRPTSTTPAATISDTNAFCITLADAKRQLGAVRAASTSDTAVADQQLARVKDLYSALAAGSPRPIEPDVTRLSVAVHRLARASDVDQLTSDEQAATASRQVATWATTQCGVDLGVP
jgi:hypothetical protein